MKTYKTNDRPQTETKFRLFVYPTTAMAKKGWTIENSETYYDVDTFNKTIVLNFKSKYDYDSEIIRWNQYANHKGGEFTVTEKQYQYFKKAYKRVQRLAYKVAEL